MLESFVLFLAFFDKNISQHSIISVNFIITFMLLWQVIKEFPEQAGIIVQEYIYMNSKEVRYVHKFIRSFNIPEWNLVFL